jgi:integrase
LRSSVPFAVVTGKIKHDPTASLKRVLKPYKKGHYAALDSKDLPQFLNSLYKNEARLFPLTKMAVELLMLTFVRTSEMIKAKWEEFDLEEAVWIIPAERMKMKRDHIVPLSNQAVTLLKEISMFSSRSPYVFPARSNLGKHMSNNTVLVALGRMGYKGKTTGHGFRALAMSTIKEKLHYRHEVVDRQLAHAHRNSVDAAYDRAQFLVERRKMMQDWADYLSAIAKENVIQGNFGKVI